MSIVLLFTLNIKSFFGCFGWTWSFAYITLFWLPLNFFCFPLQIEAFIFGFGIGV